MINASVVAETVWESGGIAVQLNLNPKCRNCKLISCSALKCNILCMKQKKIMYDVGCTKMQTENLEKKLYSNRNYMCLQV